MYTRAFKFGAEGRTKRQKARIEVNAPKEGVLTWWIKMLSSVKRAQPG